ncbi:MAG TPA: bifunctional diaminohydroxyphosphoribosylaminopyrimidine deaminase/5-amino-6-(5-phosphoribosylamino)uracil reductase RibD [Planctomycetota bacterium]|nr:bifunctional diaminohydroxyphosphoribosylaminopyrimidine deaminase/5-amino-6-(5-phosphoribosylamino)uracil reductase RibD [Planctomycetota bacterium]
MPNREKFMELALELAEGGYGRVAPNPLVGAVVVRDGRIVGTGCHEVFGGPHAEANALSAAGEKARGADLYVTLEPCRHQGKTPPCTDAIVKAGVARVFYGTRDRHPPASGGLEILSTAGISVEGPVLEERCLEINAPFFKHIATGKPLVLAKWAMTLDGKLASSTGESRWISSDASRRLVHEWRGRAGAVLAGIGTVLADNPLLNCRAPDLPDPLRVILDAGCRTPPSSRLFEPDPEKPGAARVLICAAEGAPADKVRALQGAGAEVIMLPANAGKISLTAVLDDLGRRGVNLVLVEGGSEVLGSFFDAGLIDRVLVFIAPKLVGGRAAKPALGGEGLPKMLDAAILRSLKNYRLEGDVVVEGKIGSWEWAEPVKKA